MKKTAILTWILLCFLPLKGQLTDPAVTVEPLEVFFSLEGGFYDHEVEIALSTSREAEVYYTLDGNVPGKRAMRYRYPIKIKSTTILRVRAYDGKENSPVVSQTYLIEEPETNLMVVSIGVAPYRLFDAGNGIFMQGNHAVDTLWQKPGANFWSRSEFPVSIEMYEPDGRCVYNNLSGFRLFGGMSRLFPQKSIALVARNRYGKSRFDYPIFGEDGLKKFKFLVLRNSGSDFGKSHFRDVLMTSLTEGWDLDKQDYRPSHVYINGKYWGIYHIREKVNRFFIAGHNDVDKDSLDLIEHRITRKRGSTQHYRRMMRFLDQNDLSDPDHFAYLNTQMEIDNFMDLQIAEIYFDNQDAGGNIKFWRPQTEDGRWRWILYDTDWGFGLHDTDAYKNNSLAFHTESRGPSWPNPPWSTFLLRKLLENPGFRQRFVNRFADRLNTCFSPAKVNSKITEIYNRLEPEMPRHLRRWRLSETKWRNEVAELHEFAAERARYVRMHLMEKFETGASRDFSVSAGPGGAVYINNNLEVRGDGFDGVYFEKIPVAIQAVPDYGYRFSHWEGLDEVGNQWEFKLYLTRKEYRIRAVFEPFVHPLVGKVMINEINANNKTAGDWIELFNYTEKEVSLKDWVLTDRQKNEFIFPDVRLDPNDYVVVCRDSVKFRKQFPTAYNIIGGMGFGLNKRSETLGLFSRLGAAVDSVSYTVPPTDSTFTLSLLLPHLDNSDPENWEIRMGFGSPNAPNPYYVESSIRMAQNEYMQMGVAGGVVVLCLILLGLRHRGVL